MATKRTPLMAGNWKLNLNHQEAVVHVQKLAWTLSDKRHDYAKAEVAVLPPFTDLRSVQTLVDGDRLSVKYGAQDVSEHDEGAYTGEVSARMLAKLGCSYVCVGHSERRQYHGETDELVNAKAHKAHANQMTPMPTVSRSRLRSATDEPPSELETPPPNMSDRPPPRPLCSRTRRIIKQLDAMSMMVIRRVTVVEPTSRSAGHRTGMS